MAKPSQLSDLPGNDHHIIGIAGTVRDYQLVYHINKFANLHLSKKADYVALLSKPEARVPFSFFQYDQPSRFLVFYLISNKSNDRFLMPVYKQADFLLFVNGPLNDDELKSLLRQIREIPVLQTAFKLDPSRYKQMEAFYENLELHTIEMKNRFPS